MVQFNGSYGCPYCLHPGETVKTSERGHTQAYPFHLKDPVQVADKGHTAISFEKRTHMQTVKFANEADSPQNYKKSSSGSVKGVKGMTWSMLVPGFDVIKGVTIDYMHCILLGITKMLLTLWTEKTYSNQPWYLAAENIKILERRYLGIQPPNAITRTPRSLIKNLAHFKASELRAFLLYYSLPCLWGLLKEEYFQHFLLLVDAIFLLLTDSISPSDIDQSSKMLVHFCARMESLYGRRYETYNVHMLIHLPECVRNLGPLWSTSCFWFEGYNGDLSRLFHGTQNVDIQITHAVCIHQKIPELIPLLPEGSPAKNYYKHLVEGKELSKVREKIGNKVYAIGAMKPCVLSKQVKDAVEDDCGKVLGVEKFKRLWKQGTMYHSIEYQRSTKRNSYTVEYFRNGLLHIGEIQYFLKCSLPCASPSECEGHCSCDRRQYVAVLNHFDCDHSFQLSKDKFTNASVGHIAVARRETKVVAVSVVNIMSMCVSIKFWDRPNVNFICRLANRIEKD